MVVTPEPTATAVHVVAIKSLSVTEPCRISGTISFTQPYHGSITLDLTYHETSDGPFEPTGNGWTQSFNGETSATFVIAPWSPAAATENGGWVNAFRIEVSSASPPVANMETKTGGFKCDSWPRATSSPTASPTSAVTGTPVLPAASPTITATAVAPTVEPTATAPTVATTALIPTMTATPAPPTVTPTVATVTPTATPVGPPAVTATPGATPSPTATATLVPPDRGVITIAPDNSGNGDPGGEMAYTHMVTNSGREGETAEIELISSMGWPVAVFAADGATPLSDTNGNGKADTGRIRPGRSTRIVVKVAIPAGAHRNQRDITIVSADPASPGGQGETVRDTTTVNGVITMTLSTPSVRFGGLAPSGSGAMAEPGVSSTADASGAYYTKDQAVQVTVSSNAPWAGTVQAQENSGTAATISIADGDLRWRNQGDSSWTSFAPSPSDFAGGSAGIRSYWHDYGLTVLWEDDPGSFDSVVTYIVSQ